jgi:Ser-tRNA(Ala) deacylase AlaX
MGCDGAPGTVGGDAVTTLLYHPDSCLWGMEATVTRVEGERVPFDRTVFYAQSGGQPADHGMLSWPGGAARVVDVRRAADAVGCVRCGKRRLITATAKPTPCC